MKGRFLIGSNEKPAERNIYSDKSALILDWLLRQGIKSQDLSLRNVSNETGVSLGLVQYVFEILVLKGILQTEGIRTAKKFFLKDPKRLLEDWLEHYSIVKSRVCCSVIIPACLENSTPEGNSISKKLPATFERSLKKLTKLFSYMPSCCFHPD